jgi:hypothetical protein
MSIISKLFHRKDDGSNTRIGGMEDFMNLVRVYYQASMAANLGISNLAMLPDLRTFKTTLHVATVNNKLGLGEKNRCRKMMEELYDMNDNFFKEIDMSIKKNCHKLQDVQPYFVMFGGFTQDIMMLVGNLMKIKLRMPSFFKKALYQMTEKTVNEIFTKNDYKDASTIKTVLGVRQYAKRLDYSQTWITDFVYRVVMLAKKEPRPKDEDIKK